MQIEELCLKYAGDTEGLHAELLNKTMERIGITQDLPGINRLSDIAAHTEKTFVRKYRDVLGDKAKEIHRKAKKAHHKAVNFYFTLNGAHEPASKHAARLGAYEKVSDFFVDIVDYNELFDDSDYESEGLDIFSPAAYFYDLMRLTDKYITSAFENSIPQGAKLTDRRPDLFDLLLSKENTETEMPYTDIISQRLYDLVVKLYDNLKTSDDINSYLSLNYYPASLPFNTAFSSICAALPDISYIYAWGGNAACFALGATTYYMQALFDNNQAKDFYPGGNMPAAVTTLDMDTFCNITGLSPDDTDYLFNRNISDSDIYQAAAKKFFINKGLEAYPNIDDKGNVSGLTPDVLNSIIRFVRIAKLSALDYREMDSLCDVAGDLSKVSDIFANLMLFCNRYNENIQDLMMLCTPLALYGEGSFNDVFNKGAFNFSCDKTYNYSDIANPLCAVLSVRNAELDNLAVFLYGKKLYEGLTLGFDDLCALYRNVFAARLLNLSITEYIALAELIGSGSDFLKNFSFDIINKLLIIKTQGYFSAFELSYISAGENSYCTDSFTQDSFNSFFAAMPSKVSDAAPYQSVESAVASFLNLPNDCFDLIYSFAPDITQDLLRLGYKTWHELFYLKDKNGEYAGKDAALSVLKIFARVQKILVQIKPYLVEAFAGEIKSANFSFNKILELLEASGLCLKYSAYARAAVASALSQNKSDFAKCFSISETDADAVFALNPAVTPPLQIRQFTEILRRTDSIIKSGLSAGVITDYINNISLVPDENHTPEDIYAVLSNTAKNLAVPVGIADIKRRVLVDLAIYGFTKSGNNSDIKTPDDLFAYLLLDVSMSEKVKTTYIREGINAVIMYIQRCLLMLEKGVGKTELPTQYWDWVLDYSKWQANRLSFVYPENYLMPETRRSCSALYKDLIQGASGTDISDASLEGLYKGYLEDYAKIAAISPFTSYFTDYSGVKTIYIFGKTKTTPTEYYYCTQTNDSVWSEWTKIDAIISSENITPIFIWGKLYILWASLSKTGSPKVSSDGKSIFSGNEAAYKMTVSYIFQNLSGIWSSPQTLFEEDNVYYTDGQTALDRKFSGVFDVEGDCFKKISAYRITSKNFKDKNGVSYITVPDSYEKMVVVFGNFAYNFTDIDTNYFPFENPYENSSKGKFSDKLASLINNINISNNRSFSGRHVTGSVKVFGSDLKETYLIKAGEYFIFDEYNSDKSSVAPTAALNPDSSVVDAFYTSGVLRAQVSPKGLSIPKISGSASPKFACTVDTNTGDITDGEIADTLNLFILNDNKNDNTNLTLLNYLRSGKSNALTLSDTGDAGKKLASIDQDKLLSTYFYADWDNGLKPAQYADVFDTLLQCLGSVRLFTKANGTTVSPTENYTGAFLLQDKNEAFLILPDENFALLPVDRGIAISYPKISVDDLKNIVEPGYWDTFFEDIQGQLTDESYFMYYDRITCEALKKCLDGYSTDKVHQLYSVLHNRSTATSHMFWNESNTEDDSCLIFHNLTDISPSGNDVSFYNIDYDTEVLKNPKSCFKDFAAVKTPEVLDKNFNRYLNSPYAISLRYRNDKAPETIPAPSALMFNIIRLTNSAVNTLKDVITVQGLDAFLSSAAQNAPIPSMLPIERFGPSVNNLHLPQALDGQQVDFEGLHKNYNFELFYHIPVYASETLKAAGRYDEAKKWFEYIYNPLAAEEFLSEDNIPELSGNYFTTEEAGEIIDILSKQKLLTDTGDGKNYRVKYAFTLADFEPVRQELYDKFNDNTKVDSVCALLYNYTIAGKNCFYWNFKPFRSHTPDKIIDALKDDSPEMQIYHNDPFDPHAIAGIRLCAYEKYTFIEYVSNLISWGDAEFANLSWESLTQAQVLYSLAKTMLGNRPMPAKKQVENIPMSFNEIISKQEKVCLSKKALLKAKLEFLAAHIDDDKSEQPLIKITNKEPLDIEFPDYFHIPANTAMLAYWDLVDDRIYKIRNGLDINGNPRVPALFSAAANPAALAAAYAAGGGSIPEGALTLSDNHYRFEYLIEIARALAENVIRLGNSFQAAAEKYNYEQLQILAANQQKAVLASNDTIKQNSIDEANATLLSVNANLSSAQDRLDRFKKLCDDGKSPAENAALALNSLSNVFNATAQCLQLAASGASLTPDVGSPFAMTYGGREVGSSLNKAAYAVIYTAGICQMTGYISQTIGEYQRRSEEWEFQKKCAQHDVDALTNQVKALNEHIAYLKNDKLLNKQIEDNNQSILDFYSKKFTGVALYNSAQTILRQTLFSSYRLALEYAVRAQNAYKEELDDNSNFITYLYWDNAKAGLYSGEALISSLDAMRTAHLSKNQRRLEIKKTISLLSVCPQSYLEFKTTGACDFLLSEALFASDRPGAYARKIKYINVIIPSVSGAYQTINATLTQTGSAILLSDRDKTANDYMFGYGTASSGSNPNVLEDLRSGQSIAVSDPHGDAGMFTSNLSESRYLPFEGTGAVSRWHLEIQNYTGTFDMNSVSDVIINMYYTARESSAHRALALDALKSHVPPLGFYYDIKQSFRQNFQALFADTDPKSKTCSVIFSGLPAYVKPSDKINNIFARVSTDGTALTDKLLSVNFGKTETADLKLIPKSNSQDEYIFTAALSNITLKNLADGADIIFSCDAAAKLSLLTGDNKLDPSKILNIEIIITTTNGDL